MHAHNIWEIQLNREDYFFRILFLLFSLFTQDYHRLVQSFAERHATTLSMIGLRSDEFAKFLAFELDIIELFAFCLAVESFLFDSIYLLNDVPVAEEWLIHHVHSWLALGMAGDDGEGIVCIAD